MSLRRPRIKATAILPPKRPARESLGAATAPKQAKTDAKSDVTINTNIEQNKPNEKIEEKVPPNPVQSSDKPVPSPDNRSTCKNTASTKSPVHGVGPIAHEQIDLNDNDLFKSPPTVANQKRTESFSASDIESERIDDFTGKGSQGPPSPVKMRQRIRPTPFFGMRRNSTQGYGSDIEDEPRRQRHTSTSSNTGSSTPQRIRPPNLQRIRTESSCSNISEYTRDQSTKVTRKLNSSDDHSRSHATRKDFLMRFNGRTPEKSSMKMSDLIYYNPTTNPMIAAEPPTIPTSTINENEGSDMKSSLEKPIETDANGNETNMPVPQLKLGPDGEMILDEQSLVIETTAGKEARATLAKTKVIYMDEFTGNSGFYRRSKRTKDWNSEETIKFYRCLHTVGTDFSLMLMLFPNRSRKDLKLKFKKEEKNNLNLINKALLFPKEFNISELKKELDKEQDELDAKKKELEKINAKITEKKISLKGKRTKKLYKSKTDTCFRHGDLVYEYEGEVVEVSEESVKNDKDLDNPKDGVKKKTRSKPKNTVEQAKENKNEIESDKKSKTRKKKQSLTKEKSNIKKVIDTNIVNPPEKPENVLLMESVKSNSNKPTDVKENDISTNIGDNESIVNNSANLQKEKYALQTKAENEQVTNGTEILYEITELPTSQSSLNSYTIIKCSDITNKYVIPPRDSGEDTKCVNAITQPLSHSDCKNQKTIASLKKETQNEFLLDTSKIHASLDSPGVSNNNACSELDVTDENTTIEVVKIIHTEDSHDSTDTIYNDEMDVGQEVTIGDECSVEADVNISGTGVSGETIFKSEETLIKAEKENNLSKANLHFSMKDNSNIITDDAKPTVKEKETREAHKTKAETKFKKLKPKPIAVGKHSKNKNILNDTVPSLEREVKPTVVIKDKIEEPELLAIAQPAETITTLNEVVLPGSSLKYLESKPTMNESSSTSISSETNTNSEQNAASISTAAETRLTESKEVNEAIMELGETIRTNSNPVRTTLPRKLKPKPFIKKNRCHTLPKEATSNPKPAEESGIVKEEILSEKDKKYVLQSSEAIIAQDAICSVKTENVVSNTPLKTLETEPIVYKNLSNNILNDILPEQQTISTPIKEEIIKLKQKDISEGQDAIDESISTSTQVAARQPLRKLKPKPFIKKNRCKSLLQDTISSTEQQTILPGIKEESLIEPREEVNECHSVFKYTISTIEQPTVLPSLKKENVIESREEELRAATNNVVNVPANPEADIQNILLKKLKLKPIIKNNTDKITHKNTISSSQQEEEMTAINEDKIVQTKEIEAIKEGTIVDTREIEILSNASILEQVATISTKSEIVMPMSPLNAVDILTKVECYHDFDGSDEEMNTKIESDCEDGFDDDLDSDDFDANTLHPSFLMEQQNEEMDVSCSNVVGVQQYPALPIKDYESEIIDQINSPNEQVEFEQELEEESYDKDNENDENDKNKEIDDEMERFMNNDLGTILANLINGSLVVVASEDENDPDKIVNEIYVMNKETGELSDEPLDLPEDVVDCIVEELNAA